jgi:hypothetical protein
MSTILMVTTLIERPYLTLKKADFLSYSPLVMIFKPQLLMDGLDSSTRILDG